MAVHNRCIWINNRIPALGCVCTMLNRTLRILALASYGLPDFAAEFARRWGTGCAFLFTTRHNLQNPIEIWASSSKLLIFTECPFVLTNPKSVAESSCVRTSKSRSTTFYNHANSSTFIGTSLARRCFFCHDLRCVPLVTHIVNNFWRYRPSWNRNRSELLFLKVPGYVKNSLDLIRPV